MLGKNIQSHGNHPLDCGDGFSLCPSCTNAPTQPPATSAPASTAVVTEAPAATGQRPVPTAAAKPSGKEYYLDGGKPHDVLHK